MIYEINNFEEIAIIFKGRMHEALKRKNAAPTQKEAAVHQGEAYAWSQAVHFLENCKIIA